MQLLLWTLINISFIFFFTKRLISITRTIFLTVGQNNFGNKIPIASAASWTNQSHSHQINASIFIFENSRGFIMPRGENMMYRWEFVIQIVWALCFIIWKNRTSLPKWLSKSFLTLFNVFCFFSIAGMWSFKTSKWNFKLRAVVFLDELGTRYLWPI